MEAAEDIPVTEAEKLQREREQLRAEIREAHETLKDLRAATKEAKEAFRDLTQDALNVMNREAQEQIQKAFQDANNRGVQAIDRRIRNMIKYLIECGVLPKSERFNKDEEEPFLFEQVGPNDVAPQGVRKL